MNFEEKIEKIKNLEKELIEKKKENDKLVKELEENIKREYSRLHPLPWEFISADYVCGVSQGKEQIINGLVKTSEDRIIDSEGQTVLSTGECPSKETILEIFYIIKYPINQLEDLKTKLMEKTKQRLRDMAAD